MRYLIHSYTLDSLSFPNECFCLLVHFLSSFLFFVHNIVHFFSLLNHTQVDQILFVWATAEFEGALTSAQMDYLTRRTRFHLKQALVWSTLHNVPFCRWCTKRIINCKKKEKSYGSLPHGNVAQVRASGFSDSSYVQTVRQRPLYNLTHLVFCERGSAFDDSTKR